MLYLRTGLQDVVIAALMERTPEEIQTQIPLLIRRHEQGQLRLQDLTKSRRPAQSSAGTLGMAKGPQIRPPYNAEDYERLLKMHRVGASAERIALALDRSIDSVISHFLKHRPIWHAAGEYRDERRG